MKIRRSRLTADFVQIPNRTARDDRLSYAARGVLAELLSRPDGWEATADDLWRLATKARGEKGEGRRVMRAVFAELKEAGYLVAERQSLGRGRVGTVLTLYDIPGGADVPLGGTSAQPGTTDVSAGRTDVPPAGTSDTPTDVPPIGTSAPPGTTDVSAGRTDVPPTDVPHGGTSKKKTVKNTGEKTGVGDGRRPTTGSGSHGGSGDAARINDLHDEVSAAAVGLVVSLLPRQLRDTLPERVPRAVTDAITAELRRGLTTEQLVTRAEQRWNLHGYSLDADTEYGGRGLQRPIGVAVALVCRGDCTHPRCNDGTDLDTGDSCRTCERTQDDHMAAVRSRPALHQVPTDGVRDPLPAGGGVPGQQPLLTSLTNPEPVPAPRTASPAPSGDLDGSHSPYGRCSGCSRPMARPTSMCQRCVREQAAQAAQ
ncbi:hypothetical protein [Streptomyces stelliscabiei]|uniref:hypothetical protein n=1 Tax=Streptomyces stelliscabiei TaxID=146820 RepID=UPI0029B5807A|nr:hypothetical protein [Streptomyces stelliscabiei]MDX2639919.1 hypothetical protein [Streptomyces stelliscabiei]MDX2662833.1 hypothetical protein [Streptomyces stelliscabiei]MDX2792236.1 hypothetical protein [Streptomyces stelliscabiei]